MKIVYLANSKIPSRAANSIHVMKMCNALASIGNEVVLLVPSHSEQASFFELKEFYGVEKEFKIEFVKNIKLPKLKKLTFAIFARGKIKKINPDMILSRSLFGSHFSPRIKGNHFFERHSPFPSGLLEFIKKQIFKHLMNTKKINSLICISDALKNYFQETYNLNDNLIKVLRDAADIPTTELDNQNDNETGNFKIGYAGHLYPGKGMELILPLAEMLPKIEFHIYGGKEEDIKFWSHRNKSDNLFLHGFVKHGNLPARLLKMDVLIAPYQKKVYGGARTVDLANWMSPLKLFEYMAAGKSIICSDLAALREVLEHGKNALLVSPEDVTAWKDAIIKLKTNNSLRNKLGKNAKEKFLEKYTWKKRAEKILSLGRKQ